MDILSHTCSGLAIATVVAGFSQGGVKEKATIVFCGLLGGALPDIDAISMWSGFDSTIGAFFGLEESGFDIYFGKHWYSHHGATHSLFFGLLYVFVWSVLRQLINRSFQWKTWIRGIQSRMAFTTAFLLGYYIHLLEDLPTPAYVWDGIDLFYPFGSYVGGSDQIWWWNNYDLFLIICAVIVVNAIINILPLFKRKLKGILDASIFGIGCVLFLYQINTRETVLKYTEYESQYPGLEAHSKEVQKEILGERIFNAMEKLDDALPVFF